MMEAPQHQEREPADAGTARRANLRERLDNPYGVLSRTDLAELGWNRRAVDAIFRALPVVVVPGYSRPHLRVADYLAHVEASTFGDDRVRVG